MNHKIRIALFIISLVSFAAGHLEAAESIPFSLKRGIPEIEVVINDSIKATFAIDTGADHLYIDKTFAEKHGLLSGPTQPMRPTKGAESITEAKLFNVESLEFGDRAISDLSMVAIDLVSQIKDTSKGSPDGVIGYYFLKDFNLELDYKKKRLRILSDYSEISLIERVEQVPFSSSRHLIIVEAKVNGSIAGNFILDTGSSYTILTPEFAALLGFSEKEDKVTVKNFLLGHKILTANVKSLVRNIDLYRLRIGDNKTVDGILGTTFLVDRHFIIDYQKKELLFFPQ